MWTGTGPVNLSAAELSCTNVRQSDATCFAVLVSAFMSVSAQVLGRNEQQVGPHGKFYRRAAMDSQGGRLPWHSRPFHWLLQRIEKQCGVHAVDEVSCRGRDSAGPLFLVGGII